MCKSIADGGARCTNPKHDHDPAHWAAIRERRRVQYAAKHPKRGVGGRKPLPADAGTPKARPGKLNLGSKAIKPIQDDQSVVAGQLAANRERHALIEAAKAKVTPPVVGEVEQPPSSQSRFQTGSSYGSVLAAAKRVGAANASDAEAMALFCDGPLQLLAGAVSPKLVWEGAQKRGLSTLELGRLSSSDVHAVGDLMWEEDGEKSAKVASTPVTPSTPVVDLYPVTVTRITPKAKPVKAPAVGELELASLRKAEVAQEQALEDFREAAAGDPTKDRRLAAERRADPDGNPDANHPDGPAWSARYAKAKARLEAAKETTEEARSVHIASMKTTWVAADAKAYAEAETMAAWRRQRQAERDAAKTAKTA